jgi:hypothetical protein
MIPEEERFDIRRYAVPPSFLTVVVFSLASQHFPLPAALTLKRYKFNWSNPTAHWSLNLDDKTQRAIMMQIIAINNFESEFSKNSSGRGDTSQQVRVCVFLLYCAFSCNAPENLGWLLRPKVRFSTVL